MCGHRTVGRHRNRRDGISAIVRGFLDGTERAARSELDDAVDDDADPVGLAAREGSRRAVRAVAELAHRIEHPLTCGWRDARMLVEHSRHGHVGDTRERRNLADVGLGAAGERSHALQFSQPTMAYARTGKVPNPSKAGGAAVNRAPLQRRQFRSLFSFARRQLLLSAQPSLMDRSRFRGVGNGGSAICRSYQHQWAQTLSGRAPTARPTSQNLRSTH